MSSPYVGEIRVVGFNFAPAGWAFCDGALLAISDYDTLFQLIGTTYGGDGQTTFALPDLRSRAPVHVGSGFALAQTGGAETVTLTVNQMPSHNHTPRANTSGSGTSPSGTVWAGSADVAQFAPPTQINGQMNVTTVQATGGSQPHDNMVPFQVVTFIVSLFGIFPSQT